MILSGAVTLWFNFIFPVTVGWELKLSSGGIISSLVSSLGVSRGSLPAKGGSIREGVSPPERVLESESESESVEGFIDPSPVPFVPRLNVISPESESQGSGRSFKSIGSLVGSGRVSVRSITFNFVFGVQISFLLIAQSPRG